MAVRSGDDQSQAFELSGRAPKWLLKDWMKTAFICLSCVGAGAGFTKLASDGSLDVGVPAAAHAAARAAVKEVDLPTRSEVQQIARQVSAEVTASALTEHQRWLNEKFGRGEDRDATITTELGRLATQLQSLDALLRASPRRK